MQKSNNLFFKSTDAFWLPFKDKYAQLQILKYVSLAPQFFK